MKILFADDMGMIRELMSVALKHRGYAVEVFADGDELLERLMDGQQPDLVITDNNMIRVSGLDVLWRMKNDERYAELKFVPVFVHSADEADKLKIEKLGGVFFQKTLQTNELFDAVDRIAKSIAKERV